MLYSISTGGCFIEYNLGSIKGSFFSESAMCFSNLQNEYSKSLSWTWSLNLPPLTVKNLFEFQAQDSDLEYLFWRFEKDFSEKSHL